MYYEEKFIDGILWWRGTPDGKWKIKGGLMAMLANQLYVLSDDERMQIFNLFCKHCGSTNRSCHCWNDE